MQKIDQRHPNWPSFASTVCSGKPPIGKPGKPIGKSTLKNLPKNTLKYSMTFLMHPTMSSRLSLHEHMKQHDPMAGSFAFELLPHSPPSLPGDSNVPSAGLTKGQHQLCNTQTSPGPSAWQPMALR